MKVSEHALIVSEFESALANLEPFADGQLYIWLLMQAGTQRMNAVLHSLDLTSEVPSPTAGQRHGDFVHADAVPTEIADLQEVKPIVRSLLYLEDLRPDFVRGSRQIDNEILQRARTAYEQICRGSCDL